ncbi:Apolipoprotein n-acyltransferase [Mycena venus]|uniref:Apolipoprotein n-acyltransferase n=1 Tax=Mycena venus TaxID=2733690 RepID=A0A8H6XT52_9AGAR|nr:Apolipoprotein n-acyltransferase [Mycena venus]
MKLRAFIQNYPNVFHISVSAVSALFGLTMTPTFVPVVFALAILLLYAPILFHRPRPYAYSALLWFSISLSSSFGRLVPALNALSTAGPSIAVLLGMSAVASAVAILAIFADVFISFSHQHTPGSPLPRDLDDPVGRDISFAV